MGPKAVFLEPLPYDQKADIDFEQACFFQRGGDAAPPLGTIFALSVGKLFFLTPCLITWWPTSALNKPDFHKGGQCKTPVGNHFCPMVPKAVFLDPLPYYQKADIGC